MKINIVTLFPKMFEGFISESIISRCIDRELLSIKIINLRDYCYDKHKQADDIPFGGGHGMVLKPEPLFRALKNIGGKKIFVSPQGKIFDQKMAVEIANLDEITIVAGHYEGIDQRVIDEFIDLEISIGDYVLTGGELPAMVIVDAVARMIPGAIKKESYENDSFFNGLLDYPQYTRPSIYDGKSVPEILLSGHHKNIEKWRKEQSIRNTYIKRRDLLEKKELTEEEKKILNKIIKDIESEHENEK